jgi:hypothetical protein
MKSHPYEVKDVDLLYVFYHTKTVSNTESNFRNVKNIHGFAFIIPLDSSRSLVAISADSVPSSHLVRITIAPIRTTFGNLQ